MLLLFSKRRILSQKLNDRQSLSQGFLQDTISIVQQLIEFKRTSKVRVTVTVRGDLAAATLYFYFFIVKSLKTKRNHGEERKGRAFL